MQKSTSLHSEQSCLSWTDAELHLTGPHCYPAGSVACLPNTDSLMQSAVKIWESCWIFCVLTVQEEIPSYSNILIVLGDVEDKKKLQKSWL